MHTLSPRARCLSPTSPSPIRRSLNDELGRTDMLTVPCLQILTGCLMYSMNRRSLSSELGRLEAAAAVAFDLPCSTCTLAARYDVRAALPEECSTRTPEASASTGCSGEPVQGDRARHPGLSTTATAKLGFGLLVGGLS
jgi:hypothetical protein